MNNDTETTTTAGATAAAAAAAAATTTISAMSAATTNNSNSLNSMDTSSTTTTTNTIACALGLGQTSPPPSSTSIAVTTSATAAGLIDASDTNKVTKNQIEKPSKTSSHDNHGDDDDDDDDYKDNPTPKFSSRRNSSCSNKSRHCTSLPIFHNVSELCEIGPRPGMECMPLRTPSGPYHHYHHVTDQTKSLQELQNEVGALLEFRDLVIETFPDLKHKMASMSATSTLTGIQLSSSLASRREWEPGIRIKRKTIQKENTDVVASSSLIRSRSNSHSNKKEPKSGEGNGSVVQDSGFSTETSSSKEAHSASSTTGAMQGNVPSNRLPAEADDELLNLLDVIHKKSSRLRDEVEYLQNIEKDKLRKMPPNSNMLGATAASCSSNNSSSDSSNSCLQKTFQEYVDKLNKEDLQVLRKERDRLLDKLAEMEAETLAGRIKATKMQDQFEELCNVKKELEDQLKMALSQKLELNTRLLELQRQLNSNSNKNSTSQSELSSHRYGSSTMVLSGPTAVAALSRLYGASTASQLTATISSALPITSGTTVLTPVVVESSAPSSSTLSASTAVTTTTTTTALSTSSYNINNYNNSNLDDNKISKQPFHSSDSKQMQQHQQPQSRDDLLKNLGRLDGLISSPNRGTKVRVTDSKKIAAILLETNVLELQRHLLTLTVQNQVLMQRLDQATKSKIFLLKKLDKSKEELDDIRFQIEEKDIELEGTKAQLRVLESKKFDFSSSNASETNRSSSSTMILTSPPHQLLSSTDIESPMPLMITNQISTPSMKQMIPFPMDEIQHHSSSTESAQDQTERDSRLSCSVGGNGPETPKRRPSKIPLPGTKGYLAPKPPTGRCSTGTVILHQRSPSGSVTSKSLSRSTGNLYGKSGPSSVKRLDHSPSQALSTSLHRPESAQSNNKDNSLTGLNISRCSSSSIPLPNTSSTKSTPSPQKLSNNNSSNSPLPKPKRDSLTSRARHLDSLSRAHNNYTSTTSSSTPSSPSSPPINNYSSNNSNHNNNNNNTSSSSNSSSNINNSNSSSNSNLPYRSPPPLPSTTNTTTHSKKESSSSFTQGQLRKQNSTSSTSGVSVRRVSSSSMARGSTFDAHHQQQHQQSHQQQQQQNDTDNGKINQIESINSLSLHYHNNKNNNSDNDKSKSHKNRKQQENLHKKSYTTSRNLINEYIAKTYIPPAIFEPSTYLPPYQSQNYHYPPKSYDESQIEFAYKHPQLLFDLEMDDYNDISNDVVDSYINEDDGNINDDDDGDVNKKSLDSCSTTTTNYQTNKGIEIKYFLHSRDNNYNNYEKKSNLRRTVSTFHVQNNTIFPQIYVTPSPAIENCDNKEIEMPCKLVGNVTPMIAKTWEQLNTFNNLNSSKNGSNRNLSRSVSNMSDDSEKLFFYHPAESKSNFHVNKVIYLEEENSCVDNNNDTKIIEKLKPSLLKNNDDDNSTKFYDSIDADFENVKCNQNSEIFSIQHTDDAAAGEGMAEIDSFEKKNNFWSLDNEIK